MKPNILIVTASDGKNLDLANTLLDISGEFEGNFEVIKFSDYELPVYTTAEEEKNGTPKAAVELTEKFLTADGFVFVAPEYNGSVPPIFLNAMAWISRSGNEDWRAAFNEKPAVVATHSGGGGQHVLMAMHAQLAFIGCNVIGRQIHTHYSKQLNPDTAKNVLGQLTKLAKA